jgi:hypothetical protein
LKCLQRLKTSQRSISCLFMFALFEQRHLPTRDFLHKTWIRFVE